MLKSNRDLLEQELYPEGEFPVGHDSYAVFRRKDKELELLVSYFDIMEADNTVSRLNRLNDSWEYFYIPSDIV